MWTYSWIQVLFGWFNRMLSSTQNPSSPNCVPAGPQFDRSAGAAIARTRSLCGPILSWRLAPMRFSSISVGVCHSLASSGTMSSNFSFSPRIEYLSYGPRYAIEPSEEMTPRPSIVYRSSNPRSEPRYRQCKSTPSIGRETIAQSPRSIVTSPPDDVRLGSNRPLTRGVGVCWFHCSLEPVGRNPSVDVIDTSGDR